MENKNKIKKSAVIAFMELLLAVEEGEEVLLLRSSDSLANESVQTYTENLNLEEGTECSAYQSFTDKLAEKFQIVASEAKLPTLEMPDKAHLSQLATVLFRAKEHVLG